MFDTFRSGAPDDWNRCRKWKWMVPGRPTHVPSVFGGRSISDCASAGSNPAASSAAARQAAKGGGRLRVRRVAEFQRIRSPLSKAAVGTPRSEDPHRLVDSASVGSSATLAASCRIDESA